MHEFPYHNPALPIEKRLDDLISRLNVEEKIGQLVKVRGFAEFEVKPGDTIELTADYREFSRRRGVGSVYGLLRSDPWTGRDFNNGSCGKRTAAVVGAFDRDAAERSVPIPLQKAEEAPHGLDALDATVFPCDLAQGATFDPDLAYRIGLATGREALACGVNTVYAPVLDLAVDPRWSRVEECYSEDAELTAVMGEAAVRGLLASHVLPILKHFVGGGASEGGLNQNSAHFGLAELHNRHLRPFRRAIAAGAGALMSTYHDIDGEPCSGSRFLLTDLLRGQLGFDGFVIADGGAVELLYHRRLGRTLAEAAARALKSGCDTESGHAKLWDCGQMLLDAVREKLLKESDIDIALRRVLRTKFKLGWFDRPAEFHPEVLRSVEHRALALEVARKSIVLVKNTDALLPLDCGKIRRIALTGPNAADVMNQLGDYTSFQRPGAVTTVLDALKKESAVSTLYAPGCKVRSRDRSGFAAAVEAARRSDCCVAVLGGSSWHDAAETIDPVTGAVVGAGADTSEFTEKECGEGTDRSQLDPCGVQLELLAELKAVGKPLIAVLIEGRPLAVDRVLELADAVLIAFYPGEAGGTAVADTLFGRSNPSGKLPLSIPFTTGQLPVCLAAADDRRGRYYLDGPAFPALEFGFGLSYTTYAYSDLQVVGREVEVKVSNTGTVAGDEVAEFYLTAHGDCLQRPWCELCSFNRCHLEPGETKTLRFTLTDDMLYWFDRDGRRCFGVKDFTLRAGGSPHDTIAVDFSVNPD